MIDLRDREALAPLAAVIANLHAQTPTMEFLLIGAAARDLLLVHQYGLTPPRRTADVDLAFWLPDWPAFEHLRASLLESGLFAQSRLSHRLRHHETGIPIDLIPFGDIESTAGEIAWPPDADPVMFVIGYATALASAETLLLPGDQHLKVITLPMLALLKLLTWEERHRDSPRKDALDLMFVLDSAPQAVGFESLLDAEPRLTELEDFDVDLAGAWLLGARARHALERHSERALETILRASTILHKETDPDGRLQLIGELRTANPERARHKLAAFANGLQGVVALHN